MKIKTKLLYLAAFLVIGLPLVLTGNGGAGYLWDGAVQDPVTGGWVTPNDMVCIVGVHTDGTLDIAYKADGTTPITNARECIYFNKGKMNGGTDFDLRALDTSAKCLNAGGAGNTDGAGHTGTGTPGGARHSFATSICVDGDGIGMDLSDLDRTYSMCVAKGGTWKQTSSTPPYPGALGTFPTPGFTGACVAYVRQFKYQDSNGTPLEFGTKGTITAQAGFCYAAMNMTTAFSTEALCPVNRDGKPNTGFDSSTAYDYSWPTTGGTANKCIYGKGIKGYPASALTNANGSSRPTTTWLDLSGYLTMGDCLANGGSWNNWVGQPALGTSSVATTPLVSTIPKWDLTKQAPETTQGCLHCHSTLTQYNGPFERQKDSYLNHGHKNILRKVTAGKKWAGPDADGVLEFYTSAATGEINFTAATAKIDGVDKPLLYIFGDWMTPAPGGLHTIVDMFGEAKADGTSSELCASCHTTGWNNPTAGLCSLSSNTTEGTCTLAGGTWYPAVGVMGLGTPGFTPAEPLASFPGTTFTGAGKWDRDGVQCPRCHNATAPRVVATQIAASQFPSTHATAGGMGSLPDGVGRTNLCFGCHQNIAKKDNGKSADADLEHPENLQVTNTATAPNYVPEFEGRGPGNMFLNSVHGQFTGKIVPNAVGNYDLEDTTGNNDGNASKYKSKFQGYTCWQSSTSSSPAATMIVGEEIHEIKTKADCESLYGAGSWRPQLIGGVAATQGACSTCHNVHNSRFYDKQKEAAFWKVCTDCHNKSLATINHLTGPGTPLGNLVGTPEAWEACATCHMPRATPSGIRMHLWRINTNANYRTFPTATEFGADGSTPTKKIANAAADGSYTNAVWVDVDYVCGQCHGASFGRTATKNGAQYYSKKMLSQLAKNMHSNPPPNASFTPDTTGGATVTLTDTSTDDCSMVPDNIAIDCQRFPDNAVTVNWGDGTTSTGNAGTVFSHTYGRSKKYKIVYSVVDSYGNKKSKNQTVNVKF